MKYLLIVFLSISLSVYSTEFTLNERKSKNQNAKVLISSISWDSLDVFTLNMPVEQSNGKVLKLLCSFNSFYKSEYSRLILTQDSIYRGISFKMSEQSCLQLFNFLKLHFEIITKDNSLVINIDTVNKFVKSIGWNNKYNSKDKLGLNLN